MMFTCARYTKHALDTDKSTAENQHLPSSLITAGPVLMTPENVPRSLNAEHYLL